LVGEEDKGVAGLVAAFEHKTGKKVDLLQPTMDELFEKAEAALAAGQPPHFAYGILMQTTMSSGPMRISWSI
jgi:hypothetical protein